MSDERAHLPQPAQKVEMHLSPWRRDRHGCLVRELRAVEIVKIRSDAGGYRWVAAELTK